MKSYFDTSINPAGYIIWGKDTPRFDTYTFMASWKNYGPGYDEKAEAASNVTLVLADTEVAPYRLPVDVFQTPDGKFGNVHWIDRSSL